MAAPTYFFMLGTTDLSGNVDIQKYDINKVDVYETWTDGNWIEHRVTARTRIEGTVILGFADATDYATFTGLLSSQRAADGTYPCTLYVNNTGAVEASVSLFLEPVGAAKWSPVNSRQWLTVTITVRER